MEHASSYGAALERFSLVHFRCGLSHEERKGGHCRCDPHQSSCDDVGRDATRVAATCHPRGIPPTNIQTYRNTCQTMEPAERRQAYSWVVPLHAQSKKNTWPLDMKTHPKLHATTFMQAIAGNEKDIESRPCNGVVSLLTRGDDGRRFKLEFHRAIRLVEE